MPVICPVSVLKLNPAGNAGLIANFIGVAPPFELTGVNGVTAEYSNNVLLRESTLDSSLAAPDDTEIVNVTGIDLGVDDPSVTVIVKLYEPIALVGGDVIVAAIDIALKNDNTLLLLVFGNTLTLRIPLTNGRDNGAKEIHEGPV